jgi:dihydrofolate reductase
MTENRTTCHVSISIDGFIAGPNQSLDDPIGEGGQRLHVWHWTGDGPVHPDDEPALNDLMKDIGAVVMGRNMFGPIRGEWDEPWDGWWGEEPPYHAPVFVLTHYPRESVEMDGGTTFHFVTDGFESALAQAKEAAAGKGDVRISGGASTIRQAFAANALDELVLDVIPVVLGEGESIFAGLLDLRMQPVEVTASPNATHIRYEVLH